ncbi:hypothetical protein MRX96_035306 [Rhipicephalus microplus]
MQRQTTNMRETVSVQKRVAVALYKLCSSAEDRTVANLFDLGRSTVTTIHREFGDIVVEALEDQQLEHWMAVISLSRLPKKMPSTAKITRAGTV